MNASLQQILALVEKSGVLPPEEKTAIAGWVRETEKAMTIIEFKLDRTEKVKKTTAILLEETIQELELKRKAVEQTNTALQRSLEELKATQQQLIHSEKMASLGEMTAGIAHEIQNPLNFVNNFSELNNELIEELKKEKHQLTATELDEILDDIFRNNEKINHHGKRADAIVKGMLQHSRTGSGQKELTDINALCEEYLRLAYHGLRARDSGFNASFDLVADPAIGKVSVMPQDLGRVILNLINNAFYAVNQRQKQEGVSYMPKVVVRTSRINSSAQIRVEDNGTGIPGPVKDKIFQPFFTTKPTGQGTGLGLSLAYDIITKGHGGELKVESREGEGTSFIIRLPENSNT
jgi:signal transduction histidine kinase